MGCSGIFYKADPLKNLWYFKNQDAYYYLKRAMNKSDGKIKEVKNVPDSPSCLSLEKVKKENKMFCKRM